MHSQLFHPANNEDGYVSVICHRERYLKELLAMGWFETADEALKPEPKPHEVDPDSLSVQPNGYPDVAIHEPMPVEMPPGYTGERTSLVDGLTKSQRKKLRLNK